jgi:hypothetical protein
MSWVETFADKAAKCRLLEDETGIEWSFTKIYDPKNPGFFPTKWVYESQALNKNDYNAAWQLIVQAGLRDIVHTGIPNGYRKGESLSYWIAPDDF